VFVNLVFLVEGSQQSHSIIQSIDSKAYFWARIYSFNLNS